MPTGSTMNASYVIVFESASVGVFLELRGFVESLLMEDAGQPPVTRCNSFI